ncbi:hydantoinase/oxoprolinase family protein [Acetohalobium arabaticum]|uniref:Hydantoinase/oxoprolinase n=1 Tax=Acetohalobium arabaticum (strain ATCC 49924 / DSM 5501 / Z-7288) TaxID=574087 RepID=D9QS69_ACEAZ|nr:hydantoinase/oxoprolinase family protein [Acetohalobium arabaticum]ADL13360.1 Hydantoinase/oxoprolinase [Acetohalobium arabaticum DSM 5501]
MGFVLGIDTGGTYTDGVVMDVEEGLIYDTAKSLTTRRDLAVGINKCMNNLDEVDFDNIKMVSLSTTLATNATVEEQGCEVGLILVGFEIENELPTEHIVQVSGGHTIKGEERENLDSKEVKEAVQSMKDQVDAFAVSSYFSIRNPEHEEKVKSIIQEITDYSIVCGHELTSSLGMHERTTTAVLNARLLPIIAELIEAVKESMDNKGIDAPLMIVKCDGSLVSEEVAQEKPIETILSGPASSLIGATYLTDVEDGIVVDMGGTTTDVALLENGNPSLNEEGAMVGGWLTRVQAVDIVTIGVGGDSYVQISKDGILQIGPQRVYPLAWAIEEEEYLIDQLKEIKEGECFPINSQPTDILFFIKEPINVDLSRTETKILKIIKEEGPQTLYHLGQKLNKSTNLLFWQRLVNIGSVYRASLTPTDILHAEGELDRWNKQAAELGVEIMTSRYGTTQGEFITDVREEIYYKVALVISEMLLKDKGINFEWEQDSLAEFLLQEMFGSNQELEELIDFSAVMKLPIVAIGAPVEAYFPQIADKLNASLKIPDYSEVANAVGTVTGKVIERVEIEIKPDTGSGYIAYAPLERREFSDLTSAVEFAKEAGKEYARSQVEKSGAVDIEVMVDHDDVYISFSQSGESDDLYITSVIEVIAMGRPKLK